MEKSSESPIPILTIYATVLPNREICGVKIVCEDGLEINLPDQVFRNKKDSRENQVCKNRISYLIGRKKNNVLYCKCGDMINQDISILQCPKCLNRSLPSIVKPKLEGNGV